MGIGMSKMIGKPETSRKQNGARWWLMLLRALVAVDAMLVLMLVREKVVEMMTAAAPGSGACGVAAHRTSLRPSTCKVRNDSPVASSA